MSNKPKLFVLDTSVLIHDPTCLTKFEENEIILLPVVLGELDGIKTQLSEAGASARRVHQTLKDLFNGHNPLDGIKLPSGGKLRMFVDNSRSSVFEIYPEETNDHKILNGAQLIANANKNSQVILVTKDINLFLKAKSLKLDAEDYRNDRTKPDTGKHELQVLEPEDPKVFKEIEKRGYTVGEMPDDIKLTLNEFAYVGYPEREQVLVRHQGGGKLVAVRPPAEIIMPSGRGVSARNEEQEMLLDLLLDPTISLITCAAKAGTGKTYLSIAAALYQTLPFANREPLYDRLVISRPIIGVGADLGFLPGSMEEKMNPWLAGYHDNIDQLMRPVRHDDPSATRREKKRQRRITRDLDKVGTQEDASGPVGPRLRPGDVLISQGYIEIQPLSYVRGRTFHRAIIVLDEAQNTTPHEMKTLITRAGEGSKIILIGDPAQIDAPYVDRRSNGLAFVRDRMRNRRIAGTVTLTKGIRSELAELAADIL